MFSFFRNKTEGSDTANNIAVAVDEPAAAIVVADVEPEAIAEVTVEEPKITVFFPPGHFYSPIVDPATLLEKQDKIWDVGKPILGIDFNDNNHVRLLTEVFPRFIASYDYPEELPETAELTEYFTKNPQFSWLDSRTLLVLLQHLRPKRIVEIGSGFSSLLTADVNNRLLHNSARFSCIEPYPREFLRKPLPGLQPGVIVHFHDIFLPHEYPRNWVLDDNRSWNEQYLIRALLMYSTAFKVYFGCAYAFIRYPHLIEAALHLEQGAAFVGGSLWLERI